MPSLNPMRVLVAPDKFKGTLTAEQACRAIRRGWLKGRPNDILDLLPISDGGDGFGLVLGRLLRARGRTSAALDAAHRRRAAPWWWDARRKRAVVESAAVIGLALLPPGGFHPFDLDTFGLGMVLESASQAGVGTCIVGIGGSATNDGGFGLARALGWTFEGRDGKRIERWVDLPRLVTLRPPGRRRLFRDLVVAVDVRNPLLGRSGASRVYGPQKGLQPDDIPIANACLRRLAQIAERQLGRDIAGQAGAGAAGGLGFGLVAFAGARLVPGFDLFASLSLLDRRLKAADLVITGEGAIDRSTFMGKGAGEVARRAEKAGLPCIGLGGSVLSGPPKLFTAVHAMTELTSVQAAKRNPQCWLASLAEYAARRLAV